MTKREKQQNEFERVRWKQKIDEKIRRAKATESTA